MKEIKNRYRRSILPLDYVSNQNRCYILSFYKYPQLFTQFGCDDQPMLDHVTELLASLPEGADENQEEENGEFEDDDLDSASSDEEEMDTQ